MPENERDDRLLRLEHSIARQLAEADDAASAVKSVIAALCTTEGWDYGRYWQVDPVAGVLRCAASWENPDSATTGQMAASESDIFTPGIGLAGRVWQTGQPLWIGDLGRQAQPAVKPVANLEFHGACLFPVAVQGRTIGVMSFVSPQVRQPDRRLLETFRVIGSQLGQFLQRKEREEEIAGLNAALEERVRQRTAQLEAANAELEAFSYSIAHDLRSPLTSIDGFTRLLEQCQIGDEGAPARHYLQRIRAGVRQMSELTDGMLALARVSRAELERGEVDLAALARQTLTQLSEQDPHRDFSADIPEHQWVHGDSRLLAQVMANLLGNAWKFSARKDRVTIRLGAEKRDGETVHFVADEGAGFDMAYAKRLFGAFQRLHSPSEFEGTGIGLALVQKIVAGHGGRIWASAQPGEGATFYFTLP